MMWSRYHRRQAPPWWPATESWPPVHSSQVWRRGRTRFVRRVALVFATLLFFSAFGVASLVSNLSGGRGLGAASAKVSPLVVAAVSGLVLFGLLYTVVRRIGVPLGGIVEGANRVADGDF